MPALWARCLPGALGRASSVKCPGLRRMSVVVGGLPDVGSRAKCGEQTPGPGSRCGWGLSRHPHPLVLAVLGIHSAVGFQNRDRKAPNGISAAPHPPSPAHLPTQVGLVLPSGLTIPGLGAGQGSGWAFFSVTRTPTVSQVSKHSWVGLAGFRAHPCCVLIRLFKNKTKPTEPRVPVRGGMWCLLKQRDGEVRGSCFTRNRHSYLGIWGNGTGKGFFFLS